MTDDARGEIGSDPLSPNDCLLLKESKKARVATKHDANTRGSV